MYAYQHAPGYARGVHARRVCIKDAALQLLMSRYGQIRFAQVHERGSGLTPKICLDRFYSGFGGAAFPMPPHGVRQVNMVVSRCLCIGPPSSGIVLGTLFLLAADLRCQIICRNVYMCRNADLNIGLDRFSRVRG